MTHQTPTATSDIRRIAAGNLSFLLSMIRCGEQLLPGEERVITDLIEQRFLLNARCAVPILRPEDA